MRNIAGLAGSALGALSGAAARLRGRRPLHPDGEVFAVAIRRSGARLGFGVPWLDDPGQDRGLVRFSRAAGLPRALPDVLGLALTFGGEDGSGERHDLLLSTTGLGRATRFVLVPRRAYRAGYTSLLPYRTPAGLVQLGARPAGEGAFALAAAVLFGPWRRFGTIEVGAREGGHNRAVRFDPVRHPLPGLEMPAAVRSLREPAYRAARRSAPGECPRAAP